MPRASVSHLEVHTHTLPCAQVLDEPTNYLDRDSLGALAEAIKAFGGGVVMITHNREFYQALTQVGRGISVWTGGKWARFELDEAHITATLQRCWHAQETWMVADGKLTPTGQQALNMSKVGLATGSQGSGLILPAQAQGCCSR